jgi:hypothetical protein
VSPRWIGEPVPACGSQSMLHAAAAGADAWAFGIAPQDNGFETLVFQRSAEGWQRVAAPCIGRANRADARSDDDVWVVGDGTSMHWDGREWREVPTASTGGARPQFLGLARFGGQLWAAGLTPRRGLRSTTRGTVQHFDGESWQEQPTPDVADSWTLAGIGGVAADDLWAVGRNAILHHDGRSWEPLPLPRSDAEWLALSDVVARSSDDVWTAGYLRPARRATPVRREPVAAHWDGSRWTLADLPRGPGQIQQLVPDPTGIWGVGYTGSRPFLLRWDGAGWWPVDPPALPPEAERCSLHGATLLPDGALLVVGAVAAGTNQTWPYAAVHHP